MGWASKREDDQEEMERGLQKQADESSQSSSRAPRMTVAVTRNPSRHKRASSPMITETLHHGHRPDQAVVVPAIRSSYGAV